MKIFNLWEATKGKEWKVTKVEGGTNIKDVLKEEGIELGTVVEILSRGVEHIHKGPLSVRIGEELVIVPRGIAMKIRIGDRTLLDLEKGNKNVITGLEGFKEDSLSVLEKLGLKEGTRIEVMGHLEEKVYTFRIDSKEINLGLGESAKIIVSENKNIIQAPLINEKGKIIALIEGTDFLAKLKSKINESIINKTIEKISEESFEGKESSSENITLKVGEKVVSIGKGKAEKILVKPV